MAVVLAFVGSKGGSLKTACCLSVTAEAARRGFRVALVDCDPQASATRALPRLTDSGELLAQDTVLNPLSEPPVGIPFHELDGTGGEFLLFRGGELLGRADRDATTAHIRRAMSVADLVVVDTAPYLRDTFPAILAADCIIIPTEPTADALSSVPQYVQTAKTLAPRTPCRILLTKTVDQERTTKDAPLLIDRDYPGMRLKTMVPSSARGKEANAYLTPTVLYATDKKDRAIRTAYVSLTTELLQLLGLAPRALRETEVTQMASAETERDPVGDHPHPNEEQTPRGDAQRAAEEDATV